VRPIGSITKEALSQAISAGDMKLASALVRSLPAAETPFEARLLQVADALRSNDGGRAWLSSSRALKQGTSGSCDRSCRRGSRRMQRIRCAPSQLSTRCHPAICLPPLVPEHRALILLKFGAYRARPAFVDQA
jgi:hypothetical protein